MILEFCHGFGSVCGVLTDPALVDTLDGDGVEMIPALPTSSFDDNKIGPFQGLEVLHHRSAIQLREHLAEGPGGLRAMLEHIEYGAASFIRQCLEDQVVINAI